MVMRGGITGFLRFEMQRKYFSNLSVNQMSLNWIEYILLLSSAAVPVPSDACPARLLPTSPHKELWKHRGNRNQTLSILHLVSFALTFSTEKTNE